MGQLIAFPIPRSPSASVRARRVFEAQREMESAQRQLHMMLGGAFLAAALMMSGLSLLAWV